MEAVLKNIVRYPELLQDSGGFWKCMEPAFAKHLENYLSVFEKYRASIGAIPSVEQWQQYPLGGDKSWKWRRESLALLQSLMHPKKLGTVLEIGAWNGWLTKHLAQMSEAVVAIDYFTHPFDGIGNIAEFAPHITAMQCNLENAGTLFKPQSFDIIVVNHCLSYTRNPVEFVKNLIPLLQPGGLLISLGNTYYGNPQKKIKENEIFAQRFRVQYHLEVFIQPVKGFMDANDIEALRCDGFIVKPYPDKILQNVYAQLQPSAPRYVAFIYQN